MVENENNTGNEEACERFTGRKQWRAPVVTVAPISSTETGTAGGGDGTASAS